MVKYLASFMSNRNNKGLTYRISIEEEVNKYRRLNPQKTPIVIFDFLSCLCVAIENSNEILFGGRQTKATEAAKLLCEKFNKLGVKMIFFLDGPIKREKIPHWLESSNIKYQLQQTKFFENIRNGSTDTLYTSGSLKLQVYASNFFHAIRKHAKVYISLENECDLDLAEYANRVGALAVVTPDTDFLIYQGDWQVWSSVKLNLKRFQTFAWNKPNLRRKLLLSPRQMPLFSLLSGNDIISIELLKHLHGDFDKSSQHQEEIAKFIKEYFPRGVPISRVEMNKLTEMIYNDGKNGIEKDEVERKIISSLNFYRYDKRKIPKVEPWLKNHVQYTNSVIVYQIINSFHFTINQSWIDMSDKSKKSYADLTLDIVLRQMGVVLYKRRDENPKRLIYFKPNHEEPFQGKNFELIFPKFDIPSLRDLVDVPVNDIGSEIMGSEILEDGVSIEEKLRIFSWICSPSNTDPIKYEVLLKIADSAFLMPSVVCYCLVKENQISIDEADVLLLSFQEAMNSSVEKLNLIKPPQILKVQPFWIGFVFNRFMDIIRNSMIICGLFRFIKASYYDGYIFHKMHAKFLNLDTAQKINLTKSIADYRIYI